MLPVTIAELYVYPIKSCKGIQLQHAFVGTHGIAYDRNWMVVTPDGLFLTQRQEPRLCLIETAFAQEELVVRIPGNANEFLFPLHAKESGVQALAKVWKSVCLTIDQGDEIAKALTAFLGRECRLVRIAKDDPRTDKSGASRIAFADGYSFLGISEQSLNDLNARLAVPLPMNRFRPNIVFHGARPYEEDIWNVLKIGNVVLKAQTRCSRCSIPGTDQETGKRSNEPLKTLATYRRFGKIFFGRNFSHIGKGVIRVGQEMKILS